MGRVTEIPTSHKSEVPGWQLGRWGPSALGKPSSLVLALRSPRLASLTLWTSLGIFKGALKEGGESNLVDT